MPAQELLIMAVTRMLSGVCVAGFSREAHAQSGLRWVRPVKEHDTLLLGDLTTAEGHVIEMGEVVEWDLIAPRPLAPHVEDWLTDPVRSRPRVLRRLEGERRARFLAAHLDRCPAEVLQRGERSLCLVRPDAFWATCGLDASSARRQCRLGFTLPGCAHVQASTPHGLPVTDFKWNTLGKGWLSEAKQETISLSSEEVRRRLGVEEVYLAVGLSRLYQGRCWPLVLGVHTVPDYAITVDYHGL